MDSITTARRVVAKLTAEDLKKLGRYVDDCLLAAIRFDETQKPEHFIQMKRSIEAFFETIDTWEKRA